jgi:hypothetical protein
MSQEGEKEAGKEAHTSMNAPSLSHLGSIAAQDEE